MCRAHGVLVKGTLFHRIYECPHVDQRASARRPEEVVEDWVIQGRGADGRLRGGEVAWEWERGFMHCALDELRKPMEEFEWVIEVDGIVGGANVYMDGSMYDGFDERCAVFGWAYVVVKEGRVVGLARGVPPPHVTSIPATEAWALAMAVERVDASTTLFYTDCKSVKTLARKGNRAALATQVNARIWCTTLTRTDGTPPKVEWVPAHLSKEQVGIAVIGDGTKLTEEQWEMNKLVDVHAKAAAQRVRHPEPIVKGLLAAMRKVAARAAWIGRATYAANNGTEEPYRDAAPTQAAGHGEGRRRGGDGSMYEGRKQARPMQLGGHDLREVKGGWHCVVCRRGAADWNRIAKGRCSGSAAEFWARRARALGRGGGSDGAGHVRAAFGNMVWCVRCGAYAVKWAVGLAEPCRGGPSNPSQRRVLGRLRAGRHPRTNARIGQQALMEVPGLGVMGDGVGKVQDGMRVAKGRTRVGYLRRPGGAAVVEGGGGTFEGGNLRTGTDEEMEDGPWAAMRRRRKRMLLKPADEGNDAKRQRADDARKEDTAVMEGMIGKWKEAIEVGKAEVSVGVGMADGALGAENAEERSGGGEGAWGWSAGELGGSAGCRKGLLAGLQRTVALQRRESKRMRMEAGRHRVGDALAHSLEGAGLGAARVRKGGGRSGGDEGAEDRVGGGTRCSGQAEVDEESVGNRKELLTQLRRAAEKERKERVWKGERRKETDGEVGPRSGEVLVSGGGPLLVSGGHIGEEGVEEDDREEEVVKAS